MRRKARRLALAEAPILFFCVVSCWQNVKICECLLGMPSFQCIGGGSVPPPITCQTLGRAARQKTRCWPWRRPQCKFFVSYRLGKMLKSVSVFLKCTVFIALVAAMYCPHRIARRWARDALKSALPSLGRGANHFYYVVSCQQNVKIFEGLLGMPSFQCIGGGSVPPPITCLTLGRVAH